jgi:hypothetical protein
MKGKLKRARGKSIGGTVDRISTEKSKKTASPWRTAGGGFWTCTRCIQTLVPTIFLNVIFYGFTESDGNSLSFSSFSMTNALSFSA